MEEDANQSLVEGHRRIVEFLEEWCERCDDFIHADKQRVLLQDAINFGLKPARQKRQTLREHFGEARSNITDFKKDLNESLKNFCNHYHITPPIQLYLGSAELRKQIIHLACCTREEEGRSAGYISSDSLERTLNKAQTLLGRDAKSGFDPSLLSYIIDLSPVFDQYTDFVGRRYLQDMVNSYIRTRSSGYIIIESGVGTGKTAFIVDQVRNSKKKAVVYHLIRRRMGNWDDPDAFLISLHVQLLKKYDLPEPDGSHDMSPTVKLNRILTEISGKLSPTDKEVIYLDSLDEAFGETGLYRHLWPRVLPEVLPTGIHFVITSRRGRHLDFFSDPEKYPRIRIEDPGSENDNRGDIRRYIEERNRSLSLDLSQKFIGTAVRRSEGNFLYTVLLIRDVRRLPPEERTPDRIPYGLAGLMKQEWARVMLALKQKGLEKRQFLDTAASLVAAFEPLSSAHLDELIGLDKWETYVELLDEFFKPQDSYKREKQYFLFWHTAFAEFIENELGPARMRKAHRHLAQACGKWQDITADAVQGYALNNWSKHLIAARDWNEVGKVFCNPDYLQERIRRGTHNSLLADVECCANHPRIEDHFRQSFRVLHDFLRRRSPWFHEYPKIIGQELVNELQMEKQETLADWLPNASAIEKPWLRKLSGPPNLIENCHCARVTCVKFSPNGRRIASGSNDRTLRIWDSETLECLLVCKLHADSIGSVAYSHDGERIATTSGDRTIRVWDASTGNCLATYSEDIYFVEVMTASFSPDGSKIASICSDDEVRIWDAKTGKCLACCVGHSSMITEVVFSPDSRFLVSASLDGTVRLWDGDKCIAVSKERMNELVAVAFLPNGQDIVSVSQDGKVKAWKIGTGELIPLGERGSYPIWNSDFVFDSQHLAKYEILDELWIFDGTRQEPITFIDPEWPEWQTIAFLAKNRCVIWVGDEGDLKVWDANTGKCIELHSGDDPGVAHMAISPDCQRVVVGLKDGSLEVWDVERAVCIATTRRGGTNIHKGSILPTNLAAISTHEARSILGDSKPTLQAQNTKQEERKLNGFSRRLQLSTCFPSSAAFSPEGHLLAAGCSDRSFMIWNVDTGEQVNTFRGPKGIQDADAIAISPDEQRIASAHNLSIYIWEIKTGKCISHCEVNYKLGTFIQTIAYSLDGLHILAGTELAELALINIQTGKCVRSWTSPHIGITALTFSPDGKRIISGGREGSIRIWISKNAECLQTIEGGHGEVCALALGKSCRIMGVVNANGSVHFHDGKTQHMLGILFFDKIPLALSFSRDGDKVFIVDRAGRFFSYELVGF